MKLGSATSPATLDKPIKSWCCYARIHKNWQAKRGKFAVSVIGAATGRTKARSAARIADLRFERSRLSF